MSHRISTIVSTTLALLCGAALPAHAYVIKVPWRGDSLPQGSYMNTTGHDGYNCTTDTNCDLDINAVRWDTTAQQYSRSKTTVAAATNTTDEVEWDMPLYSPVDGEIVACWRNIPDDGEDGEEPAACPATNSGNGCIAGGNHVTIRTDDGHMISFAHLRQGSVPASLCPIAETVLFNTDKKLCELPGMEPLLREGARLDRRGFAPIAVRKGDKIGHIGRSGANSGAHLHLGVSEYAIDGDGNYCGVGVPIEFSEGWKQERDPGVAPTAAGWSRLEGSELAIGGNDWMLFPDPVGPRMDDLPVEGGSEPALALTSGGGVAAYRDDAGNFAALGFVVDAAGALVPGNGASKGAVSEVALARINAGSRHVVAAVANGADRLQLIPYFVQADADLVEGVGRTEATVGVGQIAATPSPMHDGVLVALQNSAGALSLINYGVTTTASEQLTVERRGSAATGTAVADLDVATVLLGRGLGEDAGAFTGVVTIERRSADSTIWLRSWSVNAAGTTVALVDSEQLRDLHGEAALTGTDVDVTVTGSFAGRELIVASAATGAGPDATRGGRPPSRR